MDSVRDEMANNSACGKRKSVESALLSRCDFRSIRYLEVKICHKRFGAKNSVCYSEFSGVHFSKVANADMSTLMDLP